MATGSGLMTTTSLVLVENPEWVRQPNRTQALFAFRSGPPPVHGTGTSPIQTRQVILVENPEWPRQPDRNSLLFSFRASQSSIITQVVEAYIPSPVGRGYQPLGDSIFLGPPLSTTIPTIVAQLAGVLPSSSVFYGALNLKPANVGYIPQPGPGFASPFNLDQFVGQIGDTSQSSGLPAFTGGVLASSSLFFGVLTGSGSLSGVLPSSSTLFGPLTSVPIGNINGLFASSSVMYGSLTGAGALSGLFVGNTLLSVQQLGGAFIPLVPMTAVTDVRLNIGYQPWKVHPDDTIG